MQPGETLGVVGESGSGKTTLGRCVLRLLEPTRGRIIFDGRDLHELSRRELREQRKDMQIVYQEPFDSLNPLLSIGRQISEPLKLHTDLSRKERRERMLELLGLVGLPGAVADAVPQGLSPGTLQRCSIARAIATNPKLIVLDEPTSALPPEAEADIIRLLNDLQERLGLSYIFISHDLALVREFLQPRRGHVPEPDSRDRNAGGALRPPPSSVLAGAPRLRPHAQPPGQARRRRARGAARGRDPEPDPICPPAATWPPAATSRATGVTPSRSSSYPSYPVTTSAAGG